MHSGKPAMHECYIYWHWCYSIPNIMVSILEIFHILVLHIKIASRKTLRGKWIVCVCDQLFAYITHIYIFCLSLTPIVFVTHVTIANVENTSLTWAKYLHLSYVDKVQTMTLLWDTKCPQNNKKIELSKAGGNIHFASLEMLH